MAPKVNVLESAIKILQIVGIDDSSKSGDRRLLVAWNYILILCGIEFIVDLFLGVISARNDLNATLETITFLLSGLSLSFTHFLMSWKKDEIFALFRRMNGILEKVENDIGTQKSSRWKANCQTMYRVVSIIFIGETTLFYVNYFFNYFFLGVKTGSPIEMYFPFDKKDRVLQVVLFQFITFLHPMISIIMSKTVFGSFTVMIRGILGAIGSRFRRTKHVNSHRYIEETIGWHAEVTKIMQEFNAIFGIAFLLEYLLAMIYISTTGFQMIRVPSYADSQFYKCAMMYFTALAFPLHTCVCGHLIWNQNELLQAAIYDSNWYQLAPRERKLMVMPIQLSEKELTINYRGIVHFHLGSYMSLVRQSYSFLTFIRMNSTE